MDPKDAKRPSLAILIASKAKKPGMDAPDDEQDEPEHEPDDGQLAACEDILDAIKNRDAHALSKALANWMELYEHQEKAEPDEEDKGDDRY